MRHRKKINKLGRNASHRRATLKNLATALITHHKIRTTFAKAKAARSHVERLITYGKKDTVHSRRLAFKFLQNRTLVKKLFDEIAPTYADRKGGYTRIVKLGQRLGDGAKLAILQLVGFEENIIEEKPKKKTRSKIAKPAVKKEESVKDTKDEAKKPEKKAAPKKSGGKTEEKAVKPEKKSPKAKKETKTAGDTGEKTAKPASAKAKKTGKKASGSTEKPAKEDSAKKSKE